MAKPGTHCGQLVGRTGIASDSSDDWGDEVAVMKCLLMDVNIFNVEEKTVKTKTTFSKAGCAIITPFLPSHISKSIYL